MLDIDTFVDECRAVAGAADARDVVAELVADAVRHAPVIEAAVDDGGHLGPLLLHVGDDLTIYLVRADAASVVPPHDHLLWGVAGLCSGAEDDTLFAREGDRLVRERAVSLTAGDVLVLDERAVHSSRTERGAVAVHVYGGNLFAVPRSAWDDAGLSRRPLEVVAGMSLEALQAHVNESVRRLRADPAPTTAR